MQVLDNLLMDIGFLIFLIVSYFILAFAISNTFSAIVHINFLSFHGIKLLTDGLLSSLWQVIEILYFALSFLSLSAFGFTYIDLFYSIGLLNLLMEMFLSSLVGILATLIFMLPFLSLSAIGLTYSEIFYLIGYQLNLMDLIVVIIAFFGITFALGMSAYEDTVPLIMNTLLIGSGMIVSYLKHLTSI